jgi:hypothetical protein
MRSNCYSARVGKAASASTLAHQVRKVARIDPVAAQAQAQARRITDSTVFVSPDQLVALLADRLGSPARLRTTHNSGYNIGDWDHSAR